MTAPGSRGYFLIQEYVKDLAKKDAQVDASLQNQNFRTDLQRMAKRADSQVGSQVHTSCKTT